MKVHANAALGPAGRQQLAAKIEAGASLRAAAAALNVAPATAHRWWHRYRSASAPERSSGAWLRDRELRAELGRAGSEIGLERQFDPLVVGRRIAARLQEAASPPS